MHATHASHPTDQTLLAYGQGRLDVATDGPVRTHLETCPDCRQRVAALSTAVSFSDGLSLAGTAAGGAAASPPGNLPPGLADHPDYEILRELGQGGMGVVYLAHNKLMGRPEVLKVVSGHLLNRRGILDRFLGEIRNAAKLHHTNIVAAYAALRVGESFVLSMEYVEGMDLSRVVKVKGPLPVANACYYIHQAALGLQHAHEHGMVHRDIKPSNLMLARQGGRPVVKVLDFGLAKVQSERAVDSGLTHEGQMLGTPDYIAPEQISDARHADIRADIYSLGCTLHFLLTGRPPFRGVSLYDLLQAHHSTEATPLDRVRPDVPASLAAVVSRMMAKEPGRRFREPKEVAQALRPFFQPGAAASPGSRPMEQNAQTAPPPAPAAGRPGRPVLPAAGSTFIEPRHEEYPVLPAAGDTLIESPGVARPVQPEAPGDPTRAGLPLPAAVLLGVLAAAVAGGLAWMGLSRGRAGGDRLAPAVRAGPIVSPAPTKPAPTVPVPVDLVREARSAARGGNLNQARLLLNQYLAGPGSGPKGEAARALLRDIDLATSSLEAEALARRLSDREIEEHLGSGARSLVDGSVQSSEVRPAYARTLLEAFRRESERRKSAATELAARGPEPTRSLAGNRKPQEPVEPDAERLPTTLLSPDDEAPAPAPSAPPPGRVTSIESILEAPRAFEGRTITLDELHKVGTLVEPVKGPDGRSIGSSLHVGGHDDRLICKGDGRVKGREGYLLLEHGLHTVLLRAFDELKFRPASQPTHKCTLTVSVRPETIQGARVPVVRIVGLEILGVCNLVQVAQRQYDKAFWTVRVSPQRYQVIHGDGPAWVARLGGEEKFIKPLRKKFRDLQRRMLVDRQNAVVGSMLQSALARSVNMTIANQQQQARFASAFFGR